MLTGLMLAGCETKARRRRTPRRLHAAAEGRVPCAIDGKGDFTTVCTIDRYQTQDGLILTIRHPDDGSHRLKVTTDGRGVMAADGAAEAAVSIIDKDAIEDARYRLSGTK